MGLMNNILRYGIPVIIGILISSLLSYVIHYNLNSPSKLFEHTYLGDIQQIKQFINQTKYNNNNNNGNHDNINIRDNYNNTLLHWASKSSSLNALEIVNILIDNGCNVNAINNAGTSVLHWSVYSNSPDIINTLIIKGADVAKLNRNNESVLHWAIDWQRFNSVKTLINHYNKNPQLNINTLDIHNNTALHKISMDCDHNDQCIEIVRLMLLAGADPLVKNNYGRTPLQHFNTTVDKNIESIVNELKLKQEPQSLPQQTTKQIESELSQFQNKLENEFDLVK